VYVRISRHRGRANLSRPRRANCPFEPPTRQHHPHHQHRDRPPRRSIWPDRLVRKPALPVLCACVGFSGVYLLQSFHHARGGRAGFGIRKNMRDRQPVLFRLETRTPFPGRIADHYSDIGQPANGYFFFQQLVHPERYDYGHTSHRLHIAFG